MSDIKNIIGYLCKYLNLLLDFNTDESVQFKPEYIRLAKHNKTDNNIVFNFWTLLSKLLNTTFQINDDICLVDQVKLQFAFYKYNSIQFYELPTNYRTGSRELLIAFAWLLSNTNILEQLVEEKLAKSTLSNEFPRHHVDFNTEHIQFDKEIDCINYISHLIAKINNNLKIRKDCDKTLLENMKKIHCATKYDLDIPHLSVHDVFLAKHPDCQKLFIEQNESIINLLEIRNKWESCQGTFWKWMITVLDEKNNQCNDQDPEAELELTHFLDLLKSQVHKTPDLGAKCKIESEVISVNNFSNELENVSRYIYYKPRATKTSQINISDQAKMDEKFLNLPSNWKHLDKNCEQDSIIVSRSASQIAQKLKNILQEHDLKYL